MTPELAAVAPAPTADPRETTRRLLEAMSIKRVINVDDDACDETEQSLETVIAALRSDALPVPAVAGAVLTDEESAQPEDRDVDDVIALVSERWSELSDERRSELTLAATQGVASKEAPPGGQSEEVAANQAALLALPELLGDSIEFIKISLAEWREKGQALLSAQDPTLLLFDRSFEREGQSKTAGDELVRGILARKDLAHVRVGLLTYTVDDVGQEAAIAKTLSDGIEGERREAIVIAKSRLGASQAFPEALRMILYADELEAFRSHAVSSLADSNCKAVEFLKDVERYALMATFEASRREGAYETDNVIRMAGAWARRTLNACLREAGFVDGALSKLRTAAAIDLYFDGSSEPESLAEITWQERFDSGAYLSSLALPVEIGDIFRVFDLLGPDNSKGADRFYILLAQACDIAVRPDGKRGYDLQNVALTQLKPAVLLNSGSAFKPIAPSEADFGIFDLPSKHPWRVHFNRQVHVPTLALDACVMNANGRASIGRETPPPAALCTSWALRLAQMQRQAGKMIDKFSSMEVALEPVNGQASAAQAAMRELAAAVAGAGARHSMGLTARIDTAGGIIEYGLERYARVTDSTARGLLTLSANHHTRPADDYPLFFRPEASG